MPSSFICLQVLTSIGIPILISHKSPEVASLQGILGNQNGCEMSCWALLEAPGTSDGPCQPWSSRAPAGCQMLMPVLTLRVKVTILCLATLSHFWLWFTQANSNWTLWTTASLYSHLFSSERNKIFHTCQVPWKKWGIPFFSCKISVAILGAVISHAFVWCSSPQKALWTHPGRHAFWIQIQKGCMIWYSPIPFLLTTILDGNFMFC